MAKERTSLKMQSQIKVLLKQQLSIRQIARSLGVSRKTVRKYALTQESVPETSQTWESSVNWQQVQEEISLRSVSVKQIHQEWAPQVPYIRFWRAVKKRVPQAGEVSLRMPHVAGERCEVDYANGIDIVDAQTGEVKKTYLFCGVLPFSSYTFGEFVSNQKLSTFIESHERMWRFFGGITAYVGIDNLKAGVTRAHRYDPDINPTYCEYANHMGFAVLPARPYKPRDKASVEAGIGAIQRGFYQEVRNRTFYHLRELNEAFRSYLLRFNQGEMKDYGCSRIQRFAAERPTLKAIVQEAFSISEWRQSKVHPDCHIQVERNFYSVPYAYVGKCVRVRLTARLVEIFGEGHEAIAAHPRHNGQHQFVTHEAHYPEKKLGVARFEVGYAKDQARKVGIKTLALVESLLELDHPLRHLRRIQGILRLWQSGRVSQAGLEYGCEQALSFKKPRLAFIQDCALHFDHNGRGLKLVLPERDQGTLYLHHSPESRNQEGYHGQWQEVRP